MSIYLYWRAENTNLDENLDHTAGDDIAAVGGSASIAAAAARFGSNGILCPANTSSHYAFNNSVIPGVASPATSVGSAGYSVRFPDAFHASGSTIGWSIIGTNSNDQIAIYSAASQEIQLRIGTSSPSGYLGITTPAANIAAATWYGVIFRWDIAGGRHAIEVYNADGSLRSENHNDAADFSSYTPVDLVECRCGRRSTIDTLNALHTDNFMIASGYDEITAAKLVYTQYSQFVEDSPLILPHRSSGGFMDLSGNFRG